MREFGNDKIEEIYHGSDKIKEVYYGSELVYTAHDPRGYWVHYITGVKTYFGADADFIVDGEMWSPPWASDCSEVKIPSGVTGLGGNCFIYNAALTSVILPEGITSIGNFCFYNCPSLTSINIPEGVPILGTECFYNCTSLTSITLPESLTSLGNSCFRNCSSLILVTVLPATPPTLGSRAFESVHTSFNIKVRYPYVNAYKAATNWKSYASKISAIQDGYWVHRNTGVKTYFDLGDPSISGGIMNSPSWVRDCSEVKIPSGVTGLGANCFSKIAALTSINYTS